MIIFVLEVVQQEETRDPEVGVEYVSHVTWAIRYSTVFLILAFDDEVSKLITVNPTSLCYRSVDKRNKTNINSGS